MTDFIFSPSTTIIAQSQIDYIALEQWFGDHGYAHAFDNPDTPVHRMLENEQIGGNDAQTLIEFAGRQCYRSFERGRQQYEYIENIIAQNHGSVLEHASWSFAVTGVSRSLTHELIRHRVGIAISQESQRYVEAKDINFVVPPAVAYLADNDDTKFIYEHFEEDCMSALQRYSVMADRLSEFIDGKKRIMEAARSILPNAAETRLVWTANARTLRHLFDMRGDTPAELEIRRWAVDVFKQVQPRIPAICQDWVVVTGQPYNTPLLRRRNG